MGVGVRSRGGTRFGVTTESYKIRTPALAPRESSPSRRRRRGSFAALRRGVFGRVLPPRRPVCALPVRRGVLPPAATPRCYSSGASSPPPPRLRVVLGGLESSEEPFGGGLRGDADVLHDLPGAVPRLREGGDGGVRVRRESVDPRRRRRDPELLGELRASGCSCARGGRTIPGHCTWSTARTLRTRAGESAVTPRGMDSRYVYPVLPRGRRQYTPEPRSQKP